VPEWWEKCEKVQNCVARLLYCGSRVAATVYIGGKKFPDVIGRLA